MDDKFPVSILKALLLYNLYIFYNSLPKVCFNFEGQILLS